MNAGPGTQENEGGVCWDSLCLSCSTCMTGLSVLQLGSEAGHLKIGLTVWRQEVSLPSSGPSYCSNPHHNRGPAQQEATLLKTSP